ncbi:Oidioi.mRNA.OKI2018_I69.chr2.g4644.t1.cds [Oikopleura dioica]|uniref:Oidioi.mRNA.OKI2018_I69.chr2.g4644.t1.cds n=1 Tax=Oikopleura dioica TaxID=34765 RepID=A0ABN7SY00_OIKDI|nr:Oidioi.mRNA.OKI2018_I69.chr2.g4644.t1.cds [Oikopleura dioica]
MSEETKVKLNHRRTSVAGLGMASLGLIITGLGVVEIAISSLLRYLTVKNGIASVVAGGSLIFVGGLGMIASRSRLHLYVLMSCFAIGDIIVLALLLTDIVAEFQELSSAYSSRNTYWSNMATQLNMTLPEISSSKLSPSEALDSTTLSSLSDKCYKVANDINKEYLEARAKNETFETPNLENCDGWRFFETAGILSVTQITLAVLGIVLTL